MPITPEHRWHESATWVSIDVKIPHVSTSSADIITTECYVKVNCAPYFFEADLYGEVDPEKSSASVGQNAVEFFLIKKDQGLWERLVMPGDRNMRLERRERSLELIRDQRERLKKEYPAKFSNIGRLAVGEQIKMDELKRKVIEQRKEAELLMQQEDIETWKKGLSKQSTVHKTADSWHSNEIWSPSPNEYKDRAHSPSFAGKTSDLSRIQSLGNTKSDETCSFEDTIIQAPDKVKTIIDMTVEAHGKAQESKSTVDEGRPKHVLENENHQDSNPPCTNSITSPRMKQTSCRVGNFEASPGNAGGLRYTGSLLLAPRNCPTVAVTFSPKPDLPTHLPARESRDKDIKLKKGEKASTDALDVSERAPVFLQDKGDKFFKVGDYQSAVNAYTDALAKDPSLIISLANRAACKLHLRNYKDCIQDCTSALGILTKGTSENIQENILAQSSLIPPATSDNPSTAAICAAREPESSAITFPPDSLGLLACLSGQGCCSMRGLSVEGAGVDEWKDSIKKHLLIRRGSARYYSGDLCKAIDDFAKALKFEPADKEVERILVQMKTQFACGEATNQ